MDDSFPFLFTLIITILPLLVCIFIFYLRRPVTNETKATCKAPQAGGALPVIGHLHLFRGQQLFHKRLAAMADRYGPAFTIRMGSNRVLVLSSWEMAKECFTVHDKVFSTRPLITASKLLGYDFTMFGFAPYGAYWRQMRKITTIELLSNHRIERLKHIRTSEVEIAVKELYGLWSSEGSPENGIFVDMKEWFGNLTFNIILRMVAGKRYFGASSEDGQAQYFQKVIRDFIHLFGVPVLSDSIPMLRWWDIKGHKKEMKKTAKILDQFVGEWLEEHKQRRLFGEQAREEQDFMDVMLRILQDTTISSFDTDTIIKATSLNLIAGSDSIVVSLTWALCLILNNPQVLKKAQEELDIQIGRDRQVKESDIMNLVYLQAIVKESFRLYPPSELVSLLAATEDCTLSTGYYIPAGTHLIVNISKIQRDEHVWPDPHSFKPERFLTSHKDIDVRGQNYELLPFGSGRRSCPGIPLALQNLILAGSDTTMVSLTWSLSLLLNNQLVLKKAQDELDTHIGKDRKVEESDLKKLVYLQAIVKETLRLYPPSPIVTLRAAIDECTFSAGYHIPAGTHLMVNAWKIHRDDRVWPDPHDFKPERFLTSHKDVDVRGKNFELIPFGSGRRSCPGASLALQVTHLALARLLHSFCVATPSNEVVDMTESIGLTNLKATPLEVLLTPRLDPMLYGN